MLLSLDGFSSDCRPVRGCVIARRIGGTGGVAEGPSHAAPPPVPGSPMAAGAVGVDPRPTATNLSREPRGISLAAVDDGPMARVWIGIANKQQRELHKRNLH